MPAKKPASKGMRTSREIDAAVRGMKRRAQEDRARITALEKALASVGTVTTPTTRYTFSVDPSGAAKRHITKPVDPSVLKNLTEFFRATGGNSLSFRYRDPLPTNSTPPLLPASSGTALERARAFLSRLFRR